MDDTTQIGSDGRHFFVRLRCATPTGAWDGRVLAALILRLAEAGYDFEVVRDEPPYVTVRSRDGDFSGHLRAAAECPALISFLDRYTGVGVHEFGFLPDVGGCKLWLDGREIVQVTVHGAMSSVFVSRDVDENEAFDVRMDTTPQGSALVVVSSKMVRVRKPAWALSRERFCFEGAPPAPAKED